VEVRRRVGGKHGMPGIVGSFWGGNFFFLTNSTTERVVIPSETTPQMKIVLKVGRLLGRPCQFIELRPSARSVKNSSGLLIECQY
jgi:hypothetical protein